MKCLCWAGCTCGTEVSRDGLASGFSIIHAIIRHPEPNLQSHWTFAEIEEKPVFFTESGEKNF